jgi:hypothetical protein
MKMMKNKVEVGDIIIFKYAKKNEQHEVIRVDDNGLIWYKIKNGLGQTVESSIETIIKPKKHKI